MILRAVIADDEPPARFRVRELLADAADIEVVAEAATGRETLSAIREYRPNLLFLDVQMPAPSGVALLRELAPASRPWTIFITAHEHHALDAFALRAIDYLLKPFPAARFHEAVERVREQLAIDAGSGSGEKAPRPGRLVARDGKIHTVVPVDDIRFIEAANNYVVLHTTGKRVLMRRTMASLEAELDPRQFMRVNRATIVSLQFVRSIESLADDDHCVVLEGGDKFALNRGLRDLQARLEGSPGIG